VKKKNNNLVSLTDKKQKILHYFRPGPTMIWSKVVHYLRNKGGIWDLHTGNYGNYIKLNI
jgi:hypothetical protein